MDFRRLDRDVAAAAAELGRFGLEVDWDAHRHVSGQRALREIEAAPDDPLRGALASWVTWLTAERVAQPAARRLAAARAEPSAVVRLERDVKLGLDDVLAGLLASRSPGEARAHFDALAEAAAPLAEPARTLRETRAEAFRRLGIDDVAARFLGVGTADLAARAVEFLEATADLARETAVSKEGWPLDLDVRLARGATSGWPSRLGWRAAASLLPGLELRATTPREPPRAVGGASFARALERIGAVFFRSFASASTPFVLREAPLSAEPARAGAVFASVLGERELFRRVLGLGAGRASDQARALAAAFLLDARFAALRVALRARAADFESLGALALGAPLARPLEGVWPAPRDEDLSRFLALLSTREIVASLREREGDDWFRNPRAFATLRDLLLAAPVAKLGDDSAAKLARAFEEALA